MRVHADLTDLLTKELLLAPAEVAMAAGQIDICRHVVASFDMIDAVSNRHDVAGEFVPWNQREVRRGKRPAQNMNVGTANAAHVDV
jgi:hypothetical protein